MQHLCNIYATFSFILFIIGIVNHFTLFYVFVIFNRTKDQKTAPICPIYTVSLRFCNKPYVWFYIFVIYISSFLAEDYATLSERLCNIYASFLGRGFAPPMHTIISIKCHDLYSWNALFISLSGFTAKSRCITLITSRRISLTITRCISLTITRCMIKYSSTCKPMHI